MLFEYQNEMEFNTVNADQPREGYSPIRTEGWNALHSHESLLDPLPLQKRERRVHARPPPPLGEKESVNVRPPSPTGERERVNARPPPPTEKKDSTPSPAPRRMRGKESTPDPLPLQERRKGLMQLYPPTGQREKSKPSSILRTLLAK